MAYVFSFENIEQEFVRVMQNGYRILKVADYLAYKKSGSTEKILVNRVDIDLSCKKGARLASIFNKIGIKATFFVRLHAPEYNPFSFENYRCLKFIRDSGHEIGYHSEVIDQSQIWGEDPAECLRRDIQVLNSMLDIQILGAASHGGMTGWNNLDFWQKYDPTDFGLLYEAYDKRPEFNLFHESFYVSDSSWTYWKAYSNGQLVPGDTRSISQHSLDGHKVVYSLIHPDTYYDLHIYE